MTEYETMQSIALLDRIYKGYSVVDNETFVEIAALALQRMLELLKYN